MYALNYRDELEEPFQRELDSLIARLKGIILKEHNEDGSHKFDLSSLSTDTLRQLLAAAQADGQWWRNPGPWTFDDPDAASPNVVGLDIDLPTATYNNWAPVGIDDAILVEINPTGGNVTLTGLQHLDGVNRKRIILLRHSGSSNTVTLSDADTGSLAPYRFSFGGTDVILAAGQCIWLFYSLRSARWAGAITGHSTGLIQPGGSAGLVKVATRVITNAELEAGGPLTIVEAVSGALIVPVRAMIYFERTAAAKGSSPTLSWKYEGATGGDDQAPLVSTAVTLTGGEASTVTGTGISGPANFAATGTTSGGRDYRGDALQVTWTAVTAGTGTATVTVHVWYYEATF